MGAAPQFGPHVEGGGFLADGVGGERLVFKDFNRGETVLAGAAQPRLRRAKARLPFFL
jgi:hypothetical protein